jgi:hypothetical protein
MKDKIVKDIMENHFWVGVMEIESERLLNISAGEIKAMLYKAVRLSSEGTNASQG